MKRKKTLKIGLTGGIGTGKTTVSKIFQALEIPIYYADDRAKSIMTQNREVINGVLDIFGSDAYDANGNLNRAFLSARIFTDKSLRLRLNNIVHPAVGKNLQMWFERQTSPYAIEEAAILIESGNYKYMDKIIVVDADPEIVMKRVQERDNICKEEVTDRIKSQMSRDERLSYADYVINNSGDTPLVPQIWKIHLDILSELGIYKAS